MVTVRAIRPLSVCRRGVAGSRLTSVGDKHAGYGLRQAGARREQGQPRHAVGYVERIACEREQRYYYTYRVFYSSVIIYTVKCQT